MGSKPFIAGDKVTMADIFLFAFVDFFAGIGQPLDPECKKRSSMASLTSDAACCQLLASATHSGKDRKHERRSSRQNQNILVALDTPS
jgi:glutathione S-transferase